MATGYSKGMPERPNILFLFTDMQRADTIGALGNGVIRTPQLDRLAREGTAFTNAFSPSPVCVPARCCLHYGHYPQRTGLCDNGRMPEDNGLSYAETLGSHGYRTHAVGKCHFTPDHRARRGFQSREMQEECQSDANADDYLGWLEANGLDSYEPHGARGEMYYIPQVSSLPAEAHPSQWVGDRSVAFIEEASRSDQPWLLFSSFIHPHPPLSLPKPWHKLYRTKEMPLPFLPENAGELLTWVNRFQNRYKYRDRGLDLQLVRTIIAYYYGAISFVDYQIGRILAALEASGQWDDTLVLFSSDHGEHLGDLGCFGKRSMHDPSARVPLLAMQRGRFPAGAQCRTACSLVDIYPTLLEAAGVPGEGLSLDGVDLAGLAAAGESDRTVYAQFQRAERGLYMGVNQRWKYVFSAADQRTYLFDREADPREVRNLADDPAHSEVRREREADLLRFLRETGEEAAYLESADGSLGWRSYPKLDESYLDDPDAHLLIQDYPTYPTELPGYGDR